MLFALALALWALFSGGVDQRLSQAQARLSHRTQSRPGYAASDPIAVALANPLFPLSSGPSAVADVAIELFGIVKSPTKVAALVSIGGGDPQWLAVGQARGEVSLMEVGAEKVVFDTPAGLKTVSLTDANAGAAGSSASESAAASPTGTTPTTANPRKTGR